MDELKNHFFYAFYENYDILLYFSAVFANKTTVNLFFRNFAAGMLVHRCKDSVLEVYMYGTRFNGRCECTGVE